MKTIEIKLYKFEELSSEAQKTAVEKWRNDTEDSFSLNEILQSLTKFAEEFNIKIRDYSLGYNSNIDARLGHIDDVILGLKGSRLVAFINNNFSHILYERKGYGSYEKKLNGKYDYKRRSRINVINTCCPFTGVCFDEDILTPIRAFMQCPGKHDTYEQLLQDCISSCEQSADKAVEYENSFEYIKDTIEANDYDFTIEGKCTNEYR